MINVLFVCLGNICRSPMAEAVFKDLVAQTGLSHQIQVDSVGTAGYHEGELAHYGARQVLATHGIQCHSVSRQISRTDLSEADYIIAMDRDNRADLKAMSRGIPLDGRLHLLLDFAEGERRSEVPDPYYTGRFEEVYRLVRAGCEGLLAHIRREHDI